MELTIHEIIIIETLPPTEKRFTGTLLHEYLQKSANLPIPIKLEKPRTRLELLTLLDGYAVRAQRETWLPVIHLEAHGDENGMDTASLDDVSWDELSGPLRRINVAVRNSLIVTLAACKGAYIATAAMKHPTEPAPFCGIIGPDKIVYDVPLMHGFQAFFTELLQSGDFALALHELQQRNLPEYLSLDTGDLFRKGKAHYSRVWMSNPVVNKRVSGIIKQHAKAGTHLRKGKRVSRREVARFLRNDSERWDRYWEHFIMADLYPENLQRFKPLQPTD
jgi:hypothetical protein